jgi:hypothetical protein
MAPGFRAAAIAVLAASLGTLAPAAPQAAADHIVTWNGKYVLTHSADAKTGTSMAAKQRELAHRGSYTISTSCSSSVCIATVNDPPPPRNQYMPKWMEFVWNGGEWVRDMDWKWDCLLPDGTIEYDPAKSVTVYEPGPDGILTGDFHTDIFSGACKGTVDMPVTAAPVPPVI